MNEVRIFRLGVWGPGITSPPASRISQSAMLAAVRARKVDGVACLKLDRLDRSVHRPYHRGRPIEGRDSRARGGDGDG